MIAKIFDKFSYTSISISIVLCLIISYQYIQLDFDWSFTNSKIVNGILIFGSLMLTSYAINTISTNFNLDRVNRNSLHLLLYPLVVLTYPIETIDLRFILASTAVWSSWRNFRIFLETTNREKRIKRVLDSTILASISSLLIIENIFLILILVFTYIASNVKQDNRILIILVGVPLVLLFSCQTLASFISIDSFLFSSYLYGNEFKIKPDVSLELTIQLTPLILILILYIISAIFKLIKTKSLQRKTLDLIGVFFFMGIIYFILIHEKLSGSEFHYLSLPVVYMISQIFNKRNNSSLVNFIFIPIIISIIVFK